MIQYVFNVNITSGHFCNVDIVHCMFYVIHIYDNSGMWWLRLVGSSTLLVSFAKQPSKGDDILQKRPVILRSLLIVATP